MAAARKRRRVTVTMNERLWKRWLDEGRPVRLGVALDRGLLFFLDRADRRETVAQGGE